MANLSPGEKAVPFELPGVDDRSHALADYADKEAIAERERRDGQPEAWR